MSKETVQQLLKEADITINGNNPWDIQVHNEKLYKRVLAGGSLALGESYMDGWWDCEQLDEFFFRLLRSKVQKKVTAGIAWEAVKAIITNPQSKFKSKKVAEEHYDLGNEFYRDMLGERMQYTCAYFKDTKDLDEAQEKKLDMVCKKAQLKKGDKVVELGCGWGGFAKYAAEKYGCHVTSYNISKEQVAYAREQCKGLPVEIVHSDYREAKGTFDKVVSIGMMEHVGIKNYADFFKLADRLLKPEGIFVLHTIGNNVSVKPGVNDPWSDKYIFPGGELPSLAHLMKNSEKLFITEDVHNIGVNYDKTLMAWYNNSMKHWEKHKKDERFKRMWSYYLLSFAGAFRARHIQLWQVVYTRGLLGGYVTPR